MATNYPAKLVRVIDGDTQVLLLEQAHVFLDQEHTHRHPDQRVRLLGVWCPEPSKEGGPQATAFAADWFAVHDHPEYPLDLLVDTEPKWDSFRRLLAIVRCAKDRACLNEDLLAAGMATPNKTALHLDSLRVLARQPGGATSPAGRLLMKATA
jgi:endonuclease YncB( thermonuclease family)